MCYQLYSSLNWDQPTTLFTLVEDWRALENAAAKNQSRFILHNYYFFILLFPIEGIIVDTAGLHEAFALLHNYL